VYGRDGGTWSRTRGRDVAEEVHGDRFREIQLAINRALAKIKI